jgi:phytoene synthase
VTIAAEQAAACEEIVRSYDHDRWLSVLLAPEPSRPALFALYAFSTEIARVRETVTQPALGEMRLAWWREALEGARASEAAAHPVAGALRTLIADLALPTHPFLALIEARRFDLYDDPVPTLGFLEGYAGETASALLRLAALILNGGTEPGAAAAAGHAGVAYAIAGLLRALPWLARQGRCYAPADLLARHGLTPADVVARRDGPAMRAALAQLRAHARRRYDEARAGIGEAARPARPAFAPLALVPLYLKAMEQSGGDPFETVVEVAQWRKQWAMWRWS